MNLSHLLDIGIPVQGLAGARDAGQRGGSASSTKPAAAAAPAVASAAAPAAAPAAGADAAAARSMQPANALAGPAPQKTKQLYLENTYLFEHAAKVLEVWEDGDKLCVELDQTIFHPQGGGQPSDVGMIEGDGLPPLEVLFVQGDKARPGVIRHDSKGDAAAWRDAAAARRDVVCKVDGEKRRLFARIHSAGHLLDVAVYALGFRWRPGKGYHFPDGPYVEYAISDDGRQLDNKDAKAKQAVIDELNAKMKELVGKSVGVRVEFVDGVRTVTFEETSCGCGGTHVSHAGEIGEVVVKKLQAKSGNMRVSYSMG